MMAATLSSTSAACSRFCARSALKRSSKLGSEVLSHAAMARALGAARAGLAARMLRLAARAPLGAQIPELGLDTLDLKLDGGVAREGERHVAARSLRRLETDGKQRQDPFARPGLHVLQLRAEYTVESEGSPPSPIVLAAILRRLLPIEAVKHGGEALLPRHIGHVGDAQHRVLQEGGHDGEIFLVEGDEFQLFHGNRGRAFSHGLARSGLT